MLQFVVMFLSGCRLVSLWYSKRKCVYFPRDLLFCKINAIDPMFENPFVVQMEGNFHLIVWLPRFARIPYSLCAYFFCCPVSDVSARLFPWQIRYYLVATRTRWSKSFVALVYTFIGSSGLRMMSARSSGENLPLDVGARSSERAIFLCPIYLWYIAFGKFHEQPHSLVLCVALTKLTHYFQVSHIFFITICLFRVELQLAVLSCVLISVLTLQTGDNPLSQVSSYHVLKLCWNFGVLWGDGVWGL